MLHNLREIIGHACGGSAEGAGCGSPLPVCRQRTLATLEEPDAP